MIIIFAVFFLHMFKGTFYRCVIDGDAELAKNDAELKEKLGPDVHIDTKKDCLDLGFTWQNPTEHFDDLINATLNLMVFMTNEGWVIVMNQAVDSRGVDLQPKTDHNVVMVVYFIIYMIVSHVFILNAKHFIPL